MTSISEFKDEIRLYDMMNIKSEPTNVVTLNGTDLEYMFEDMVYSFTDEHSRDEITLLYSDLRDSGFIDRYLRLFFVKIDPETPDILDHKFSNRLRIISSFVSYLNREKLRTGVTTLLDEEYDYFERLDTILLLRSFCNGIKEKDNERYADFEMALVDLRGSLNFFYNKHVRNHNADDTDRNI